RASIALSARARSHCMPCTEITAHHAVRPAARNGRFRPNALFGDQRLPRVTPGSNANITQPLRSQDMNRMQAIRQTIATVTIAAAAALGGITEAAQAATPTAASPTTPVRYERLTKDN